MTEIEAEVRRVVEGVLKAKKRGRAKRQAAGASASKASPTNGDRRRGRNKRP